jgi:hypothetical protein
LIVGSSLIASFAGILANNYFLIPTLDIDIRNATKGENLLYNIIITNTGLTSATDLVVTIKPTNSSEISYHDIISTNGLVNKTDIRKTDNVFQIKFPRLSPSNGSLISIPYLDDPTMVYVTYKTGSASSISVKIPWYVTLTNFFIQNPYMFAILFAGILLLILPSVYKGAKEFSQKKFIANAASDMQLVITIIQSNENNENEFWHGLKFGHLSSTKNWEQNFKLIEKIPSPDKELFSHFYSKLITRDYYIIKNTERRPIRNSGDKITKIEALFNGKEIKDINKELLAETNKCYHSICWSKFGLSPIEIKFHNIEFDSDGKIRWKSNKNPLLNKKKRFQIVKGLIGAAFLIFVIIILLEYFGKNFGNL